MKICIGSDHRGYELKQFMLHKLQGYAWHDVGTHSVERTDYPLYAQHVCKAVVSGAADVGVLICGSGIGMAIAANRFTGIYAGLCWNQEVAQVARQDDGINVLILPSDFVTNEQGIAIFNAWIGAQFKGGHYQDRLNLIDKKF